MQVSTQPTPIRWGGIARALKLRVPLEWLWLGIVLSVLAVLPLISFSDPDVWWHLRTGEIIAHSGIPRHDTFSWTASGRPWVAHEWLSELIIYEVQHWLGYAADVVLFSAATVGALVIMYVLARRRGAGASMAVGMLVVSSINIALFITVRPQVFTWLLFAVFVAIVDRAEHDEPAPVWLLPLLMAIWVNLHLGFAYGLMIVALWCLVRALRRVRGDPVDLRRPLIIAALCIVATMLNPDGPAILAYPLRYVQDRQSLSVSSEWSRPDPRTVALWPYFLSVILILVAVASKYRPPLFMLLLSIAVVASSLEAVRNLPFVALLLPVAAGPALTSMWAANRSRPAGGRAAQRRRGRRAEPAPVQRPEMMLPLGGVIIGLAAFVAIGVTAVAFTSEGLPLRTPRDDEFPAKGLEYIASQVPQARLYNDYTWGGYIIYRDHSLPVFVDGRSDFYRSRILDDYRRISRAEDGWEDLVAQYGIDTMLIPKGSRLSAELRRQGAWREVFRGDVESVFVKR